MNETVTKSDNVTLLPRGGYLIDTPTGYIQIGSPPETIKDTMYMEKGVPEIFVLSGELFNWIKGISVAEIEFPIYYNFFINSKKTHILCEKDQLSRIKRVLQEAIFGPRRIDLKRDLDPSMDPGIYDIKREMEYFSGSLKMSNLVGFGLFKNNSYTYKGITIKRDEDNSFKIFHGKEMLAHVPGKIDYKPTYEIGERLAEPYIPPLFGVTCLGPSHGFDPTANTSGFIIWLNHQGIMVDPPVNSTEWLEDSNINPKLIDSIILTHCHADHDAGTFQKILEESRVTVYTTQTVIDSFMRKYSSLSGLSVSYLMKLFDFHPVTIGEPVFINGGRFDMFYTLHSIPTVGFRMEFQDQSFVYSSDHNNDPKLHRKLLNEKIISKERYEELKNFPWDSKVIYHESGVPPLHTPIDYLNSLPHEIQARTVVYHIAAKDFPEKTGLTLATFGIENTLYFPTESPRFEKAYQILGLLKNLDFFEDIPVNKAQEFIDIIEEENYRKGDLIVKKGTTGDKFYMILHGNISVDTGGLEMKKIYGAYDYFGEVALITEAKRAADIYAETDMVVYTITRDRFLNFIVGTEFEKTLKRLVKIRSSETWNLLSMSKFFQHCTSSQKTWLESIFQPVELTKKGTLIKEGEHVEFIYIIRKGEVEVKKGRKKIAALKRGDFIGSMLKIYNSEPAEHTFSPTGPVSLYAMQRKDILRFLDKNPGILMKSVYDF